LLTDALTNAQMDVLGKSGAMDAEHDAAEVESSKDSVPEMFVCPVSRELMRDPVVLVETGQIYDRSSITEWFRIGNNTCPLTGTPAVHLQKSDKSES